MLSGRISRALQLNLVFIMSVVAGKIEPTARVTTIPVPHGGEAADAKITADGTIHLLYNSGDIPYYVKSSDHGATFSSPIPVVDTESRKPGLVFSGAAMAVGTRGAVYVAMMTNNWKAKLAGVPDGLVYASLSPAAKDFTPVRSLNNKPSEGFSLAADNHGNLAATWLSGKLYINLSRDGGRTFTPNAEINPSYAPCQCCTTRAVYGGDGNLALLYRERTNDQRDIYLVLLTKDGRERRTRVSQTPWNINACPMTYYALSATNNGYVAAWPTRGEIYFSRLDQDGKVLPPGEIKTPGRSGMRTGVVALGAPDGASLIAWKNQEELGWQLYDEQGRPQGATGSVKSAGKGAAGVVDKKGRFLLFQ